MDKRKIRRRGDPYIFTPGQDLPEEEYPVAPVDLMITEDEYDMIEEDTNKRINRFRAGATDYHARNDFVQHVCEALLNYCIDRNIYLSEMPRSHYHMVILHATTELMRIRSAWDTAKKQRKYCVYSIDEVCRRRSEALVAAGATSGEHADPGEFDMCGDFMPSKAHRYGQWNLDTTFDEVVTKDMKDYLKLRLDGSIGMEPDTRKTAMEICDMYFNGCTPSNIYRDLKLKKHEVDNIIAKYIQPITSAAYTSQVFTVFEEKDRHVPNEVSEKILEEIS